MTARDLLPYKVGSLSNPMHKRHLSALLFAILLTLPAAGAPWGTHYETALSAAGRSGRPVLVLFTGSDWCAYCHKLDVELLGKESFATWADANVILLALDFPKHKNEPEILRKQNAELKKRYAVHGFPTLVVLDSQGTVRARIHGYHPGTSAEHFDQIKAAVKKAGQPPAKDSQPNLDAPSDSSEP